LRGALVALLLAVACGGLGCGGSSSRDESGAPPYAFQPEGTNDGPVVFLRERLGGSRVQVDVVARGILEVHGSAFRVTWDPAALSFVQAQAGPSWSSRALLLAREAAPGELAVAWAEKGEARGHDATSELLLGTLVFEAKGQKGTPLAFRAARSALVDRAGRELPVTWRAGTLVAR